MWGRQALQNHPEETQKIIHTCKASTITLLSINIRIFKKQWRDKDEKATRTAKEVLLKHSIKEDSTLKPPKQDGLEKTPGKANIHRKRWSSHFRLRRGTAETDQSMWVSSGIRGRRESQAGAYSGAWEPPCFTHVRVWELWPWADGPKSVFLQQNKLWC